MAWNRLRVYCGPPEECGGTSVESDQTAGESVTVSIGEILPWLADAALRRRRWLEDFEDDEITISQDLYEVIMAYQHYQRPSA